MRLADFITREMEPILAAWEAFAASCLPAAGHMGSLELRDHAQQILEAIALDLSTPQSKEEQIAKSKGLAVPPFPARETAAQIHAVLRVKNGFDVKQLVSEYRALRASVLGLWMEKTPLNELLLEDVIRFNEAVDQALTESIGHFNELVEQSRNLLLGVLSHDMRSPLQAIQMTARHLNQLNVGEPISEAAQRLIKSGGYMQALLDDLMDFNRSNLGIGIGIVPQDVDLRALCTEEVDQIRAGRPGCRVDLRVSGNCHARVDGKRVQQLLGNLMVNAFTHGKANAPVRVAVDCRESTISIEVANEGPRIPTATLEQIFEPLKRGVSGRDSGGLGLGLYIVSQIANAHGGDAQARSSDEETVFSVRLPRFPGVRG